MFTFEHLHWRWPNSGWIMIFLQLLSKSVACGTRIVDLVNNTCTAFILSLHVVDNHSWRDCSCSCDAYKFVSCSGSTCCNVVIVFTTGIGGRLIVMALIDKKQTLRLSTSCFVARVDTKFDNRTSSQLNQFHSVFSKWTSWRMHVDMTRPK